MNEFFKNQAAADKFADDLLNTLTDTYYSWTEEEGRFKVKVKKAFCLKGYRKLPAKAEEVFTGQSVSYALDLMKDKGWKNMSRFALSAESVGFTVRNFRNMSVITL